MKTTAPLYLTLAFALLTVPSAAHAFCGFYVSGAETSLYSNATMVVMMRDGTKTVLSMQNNYQGPPTDFAMVIPVPVVLSEDNVNTLPREAFQRVDSLAAPRLVEYWEQDPCAPQMRGGFGGGGRRGVRMRMARPAPSRAPDLGVTVEAEFAVGEYDIVILSAEDSGGLDTWLRRENYNIPAGAGAVLRPYVESGTKFFVAKVDASRVTFADGKAVLSPLRVHYDSDEFSLPVRLGLLNSNGQQDILVHILARQQRYEVANYENVFIPTNIRVVDAVREEFGGFYESLFRRTIEENPRAVVTEYAWDAQNCDPCPTPPLRADELNLFGADVISGGTGGFVLTRLHYRYRATDLGEDLMFRAADDVVGGRGMPDAEGKMQEAGAVPGNLNNFQGRYIITHPWEGEVACASPTRGRWGGPPGQGIPTPRSAQSELSAPVDRAARTNLGQLVGEDIPAISVVQGVDIQFLPEPEPQPLSPGPGSSTTVTDPGPGVAAAGQGGGCAGCSVAPARFGQGAALFALLGLVMLISRRRY